MDEGWSMRATWDSCAIRFVSRRGMVFAGWEGMASWKEKVLLTAGYGKGSLLLGLVRHGYLRPA